MEEQKDLPKPKTNLPLPEKDLPLPEKELPAHLASKGLAFQSYRKIFVIFILISFLIAFLIGGFALGSRGY